MPREAAGRGHEPRVDEAVSGADAGRFAAPVLPGGVVNGASHDTLVAELAEGDHHLAHHVGLV
ncbi:MAG TPA: hypothetical protein PKB06_09995, partial [Actinotalea sp.]|nr:hypothetical protein [Actinotalea sp.]